MNQAEGMRHNSPLHRLSADPLIGWERIPNVTQELVRINSDGFRGPDYPVNVPEGRKRIAVIGDSEAFGELLAENQTLSGALEMQLNAGSGANYEALNFGGPGYNTVQEARLLETKILKYHPSIIVLYYVFNDPIISSRSVISTKTIFHRLYVVCFIEWFLSVRNTIRDVNHHENNLMYYTAQVSPVNFYIQLHNSPYFDTAAAAIRKMARNAKNNGSRFILVIAPEIYGYDDFINYPYKSIHRKLQKLASSDIEVVDPLSNIMALGKKPRQLWVTDYDCHKNKEATAAIAQAVARTILKKSDISPKGNY
jgi:hypothetical protein